MPSSLSAKKRVKQNEKSRIHNKSIASAYKSQVKKVLQAIKVGDAETAEKELPKAMKKMDKAAKTRIIHKNKASRKKSQLAHKIQQLKKGQGAS